MSVIIRLQNLPWSANALDIRQYFHGLSIPEGGVHIVGGEQGDAFIAFSTDEDARQAMMADGGRIKEVKLKLFLSSRAEMQKVIEMARQQSLALQNLMQIPAQQTAPPIQSPPSHTMITPANLLSQLHAGGPPLLGPGALQPPLSPQAPPPPAAAQIQPPQQATSDAPGKKDGDRARGDGRRNRSRSRSRDRRRTSRDKDRDRYRRGNRGGGRSRSRSRDRRRRDRSRDRSKSREKRERKGRPDRDNKESKDKTNGASASGERGDKRSDKKMAPGGRNASARQAPMAQAVNGNGGAVPLLPPAWANPNAMADSMQGRLPGNPSLQNAHPGMGGRLPVNFPPVSEPRGFPMPAGNADPHGWPSRQPGMPPRRFEEGAPRGGFRGGHMMRPNRFQEPNNEYPPPEERDNAFIPHHVRGRDQVPFEEPYRRGPRPFRDDIRNIRAPPHTCVEVRDLPSSATYRDVREFFQNMHIGNIKLINDDQGRRTGIAYLRFNSLESKEAALTLTGMPIHDTPVQILHLDDNIYDESVDSYQPNADAIVVSIHGLPPYANEQDIRHLFPGARLLNVIMCRSNNPHVPQAFVQFSTPQEGRRATGASGKLTVDGKEIFVENSSFDELMNTKKMLREMESESEPREKAALPKQENPQPIKSDCILLQGLPTSANDREILDFFSDVGLVPLRIHVMIDNNNTPSGDAFCEFANFAEGVRALAKHRSILGNKEITVRPVPRTDMEEALGILEQKHHEESVPPGRHVMPRNGPPLHHEHVRGGHMGGPMRNQPLPPPPLYAPEFSRRGRGHRGNRGMRGFRGMHHHGHMPLMMATSQPVPLPAAPAEGPTVDNFGKPGCVIELQNVPYKAEIDEIIEYFDGFELTRSNIIRRYNDVGQPTGDARVALKSPADAQRAMEELKFKKLRDRPIFLTLV